MTSDRRGLLITRRRVLAAGVAAGLVTPAGRVTDAAAAASSSFDPTDAAGVLGVVARMRGSVDGRIAMGWLKARRYGVVDAEITPLFGMVTGTFSRYRVLDDGSIRNDSFELAFYTDLESGEVLDSITMPYTGKTVEVPRLMLGPSRGTTQPTFHELTERRDAEERTDSEEAMRPVGSTRFERWLGPITVKDDQVWITQAFSADSRGHRH